MTKVMNNQTIAPPMLKALLLRIHKAHPSLFPMGNFQEELKRFSYGMTNYLSPNTIKCFYSRVDFIAIYFTCVFISASVSNICRSTRYPKICHFLLIMLEVLYKLT